MNVLIEVGSVRLRLSPRLPESELKIIRKKFTYIVHDYQFTRAHQEYGWDGRKSLFLTNGQIAPAGCLYRMKYVLQNILGHTVAVNYLHDYPPKGKTKINGFDLKSFQNKAVQRAVTFRRGIISAPVRAGKTAIAASIINRVAHYPVWLITSGKDLVNQTRKDLAYHLDIPVGYFSESDYEYGQVVVTSYQALTRALVSFIHKGHPISNKTHKRNAKILQQLNSAKVVIFDECHHALAPKNRRILEALGSAGYIIGLSGTPKPDNKHMLELEGAIGAVIFDVKYATLIKHKRLAKPKLLIYQLPYPWYTTGLTRFADIYQSNIVENFYRNKFIADLAIKLRDKGKTSFVMIRHLAHGPILRAMIPGSVFVHGTISSEERTKLYAALQEKTISCIIATVGKEGLNLPKLDAVINAEGLASSVITLQKMRSLTAAKGKKYGIVIDFVDRGKYIGRHSKKRLKVYKKLGKVKIKKFFVPAAYYPMEGSRWQILT